MICNLPVKLLSDKSIKVTALIVVIETTVIDCR